MEIECVQYVGHSEDPRDSPCVLGTGWTVGNECVQYVGHSEDPKDSPCVHSEDPKDSPCVLGTVGRDGQWGLSVWYVGHSEDPRDSPCVLGTVGRDGQWGMSVFNMLDTVKFPRTPLVSLAQWDGMDSGD